MPSQQSALLALYFAVFVTSINGVLSKAIPLDAVTLTQLRCVIAAVALTLFALAQRQSLALAQPRSYRGVFCLGALMALHWSSFFHGIQVSTVAIGVLAHYAYPVITVLVEPLLHRRLPQLEDILAGLVVLTGVALMVPEWSWDSSTVLGITFGLISAAAFSTRNILQRHWMQGESSGSAMWYQVLIVALVTAPFMDWQSAVTMSVGGWQMLLLLGVVGTAFCHTLVVWSLRALSAKSVSLISCLQPPAAILLGWLILGEIPNLPTILGGSLILATAMYESLKVKAP